METKLDTDQRKAVEHFKGPALIVAGPGSGKTTVIKERILNLIQKHDVDPWKVLALAFNRDAADEIARRVLKELGRNYRGRPKFRTLHGFGKDIIASNYKKAGFKVRPETKQDKIQEIINEEKEQIERETIDIPVYIYKIEDLTTKKCYIGQTADLDRRKKEHYNRSSNNELWQVGLKEGSDKILFEQIDKTSYLKADECEAYWIQYYRELPGGVFNQSDPVRRRHINQVMIEMFCKHFDISSDALLKRKENFKDLTDLFNKMQDEVKKVKLQVETGLFKPESIDNEAVRRFAQKYEEVKSKANAIDFEDMLIYSADVLENSENLRQHYCNKHPYVLVDEFQDISPADFRLISQLSKNLFAVGDDDQAIYGFRGGDSEIMQTFYNRDDVSKYNVTRNYRSTTTIVEHAKALIECNKDHRIPKNLGAKNPMRFPIKVLETTPETVEKTLLMEFTELVCQAQLVQRHLPILKNILLPTLESKTAILTRTNAEVEKIKKIIKKLKPWVKKDIEVGTIHKAKGLEYDRVILIANTLDVWETNKPYNSLPTDEQDNENEEQRVFDEHEERRVFYVAMTRAKYELIVLGRNCQFIPEFQNVPPTKEELEEAFGVELAIQEPKLKIELEEVSKAALATLKFRRETVVEKASKAARNQCEQKLNRLRRTVTEHENETRKIKETLSQEIKSKNDPFLEGLIPVLDEFDSQIKSLQATNESNNESDGFGAFTKNVQLAQTQLLNLLKEHELKPIDTSSGAIFNSDHHEKLPPAIYSKGVPAGRIVRQERCGYLLHDQVVRKVQVVISKRKRRADVLLCQDFAQPVRFVTYAGFRDLRNIETFNGGVKGVNSQGEKVQLQNLNVLFAFPKDDMVLLKSYIKKKRDIANQNLQPIGLISERFHIADDVLKLLLINSDTTISDNREEPTVRLVTRSGHVLWGHLRNFDDEFLYMDVNKKDVIVYRAGILEFKNLIWIEITKAYKNGTPINGYITGRVKGGLQVKFKLLTGFLPASQVEIKTVRNLNLYVGKTLKMKLTKLSKSNNTIVFSRRALLEEERTKLFNAFREIPQEPITVRNIERIPKTAESILRTNGSSLFPKSEHISLDKSISVIVPKPVEEMIDTPPPISIDFTESLDTYVKNLEPEFYKTVEIQRDPLYEPIDLIVPEPVKKVVDSRIPKPEHSSQIPNPQTQDLTPEPPPIEIDSDPLETVNSDADLSLPGYEDLIKEQIRAIEPDALEPSIVSDPPIAVSRSTQEAPQGHEDILNKQIQELKPDTSDPENPDNVTQQPTLKTGIDREIPVESTALSRSDSSAEIDSDTHQIKERNSSENEVENTEKSLGYYLRRGGHFVVEKIKTMLFKKPNS